MSEAKEQTFLRVASQGEIAPGTAIVVAAGRYDVALFNVGGEIHAYENACPHQGGPIGEGWIEDGIVTCPWHGWQFDVASGRHQPTGRIVQPRFDVRVEEDWVLVDLG